MSLFISDSNQSWDVIVVGGGTAGAIAGIAASRAGAKTLVIEALGSLGGSGTNAQVTPLMRNISSGQNLNRGITDELKRRLIERCDGAVDKNNNDNWFNPEGMKFVPRVPPQQNVCDTKFRHPLRSAFARAQISCLRG